MRCSLGLLALVACQASPLADSAPTPGPECAALIAAGERARGCDPAIDALVAELQARPQELRCRGAARQLLAPPTPARGRVVSVYERPPAPGDAPLDADERAALLRLPLPGTLVLAPDLAPGPGVPATTATLDGAPLTVDADGRLRGALAPGEHALTVRHANGETHGCVTLRACEAVVLTAHGASLAPHPALRSGPCGPP